MGKNKRKQIQHFDTFHNCAVACDSAEECDFFDWCCEAAKLGFIKDFQYQPPSIPLAGSVQFTTIDNKKRVLLREHVYSPDFVLQLAPDASRALCRELKVSLQQCSSSEIQVYLDVKGTFQRSDGGRVFSMNQKWVYQSTGIYIVKVVPKEFFAKCGCPQACFVTKKTKKLRKAYAGMKTLQEALA